MGNRQYIPLSVILPITSIGVFMSAMDGSVVNVSLQTISLAFGVDKSGIQWVVIAYGLTTAAFIGFGGGLGDQYGRKKIFQIGMLIFTLGSLFCSLSNTLPILIISRIIQATGAAGIQSNGLAIVVSYIDPKMRGRAIGFNSLVVAAALSVGPVLGGVLTEFFGWQSIFWLNLPIGFIGLILVQKVIKETQPKDIDSLDFKGVVLFSLTSFSFIAGISFSFEGKIFGIVLIGIALISAYSLIRQEMSHPNPILSIKILKNRQIMYGGASALFCYMGINSYIFLMPFYMQEILKYTQSQTGIVMMMIPLALTTMGPFAGFLSDKFNTRYLATIGASLQAISILSLGLAFIYTDIKPIQVFILVTTGSIWLSLFTNANGTSIMNAAEKKDLSIISGVIALARNIGFALGTAIAASFFLYFQRLYDSSENYINGYIDALGRTYILFGLLVAFGSFISFKRGQEVKIIY